MGSLKNHMTQKEVIQIARKKNLDKEQIFKLHNEGLSDLEISKIMGCKRSNITRHLNKAGITNRKSKIDNIELRNRISQSLIGRYVGENNPNYKGYTEEKQIARGIFKTISKRKLRECNYTCQHCGKRGGDLDTHHIKPFKVILDEFLKTEYSGDINNIYIMK